MTPFTSTLDELWQDGVLQRYGDRYETTRRWRAARHRASTARSAASERNEPQNPIVVALVAFYGKQRAASTFGPFVAALFTLESDERVQRGAPR